MVLQTLVHRIVMKVLLLCHCFNSILSITEWSWWNEAQIWAFFRKFSRRLSLGNGQACRQNCWICYCKNWIFQNAATVLSLEFPILFFSASYFDSSSWDYWRDSSGCKLVETWLCATLYVDYWTCAGISLLINGLLYPARYVLKYSAVKWLLSDASLLYFKTPRL